MSWNDKHVEKKTRYSKMLRENTDAMAAAYRISLDDASHFQGVFKVYV